MKPSAAMRSKPIRIKSGQMGSNGGSSHRHSIHIHDTNMMMAASLDNYSHRGHRSFRNSGGTRHGETPRHHPDRQAIYHAGYMERRMMTTTTTTCQHSPRGGGHHHAATSSVLVTPPPPASIAPSPPVVVGESPRELMITEMLSVLGVVPEHDEPPTSTAATHDRDCTTTPLVETCDDDNDDDHFETMTTTQTTHYWTTVYCVLLDDTLYMYPNQAVAESEAAVHEREAYRHHASSRMPHTAAATTITIADIRLPLDSVASVRSAGQEYGHHSVVLAGEDEKFILRARDGQEMNEWMFQFLRSIASVLRGLMDSAQRPITATTTTTALAVGNNTATVSGVEYSPVRCSNSRRMLSATASYSPRLSLPHARPGRSTYNSSRQQRHQEQLEGDDNEDVSSNDVMDHVLPFPIDGNHRLISPLLPRRDAVEPELCMPQTTAEPETERPMPYVPPHRRNNNNNNANNHPYVPRSARAGTLAAPQTLHAESLSLSSSSEDPMNSSGAADTHSFLGGCADPGFVAGSIMDDQFIPRMASKLRKVRSEPFGFCGDGVDIGAFSECGPAKDTNEDSFMISTNLHRSFDRPVWDESLSSKLFCIFDGHGGDHAARFAAEQLTRYMYREALVRDRSERLQDSVQSILENALLSLDTAFCNFCQEGGRDWDSGSTALVAILIEKKLVIGNIGDARGIIGRTVNSAEEIGRLQGEGWNELSANHGFANDSGRHLWKEVTDVHSPNRSDEAERIALAGGWITQEQMIPVSQLKRMDLDDDEVYNIIQRCFADRCNENASASSCNKASAPNRVLEISRTVGDLAVSRALGDRHYKASYNVQEENSDGVLVWDSSHLFLCYPDKHDCFFSGDLVSNQPEFTCEDIGDAQCGFLLLACDGLWDVLDADDAYRVTHDLLFEKGFSSKQAAARLAELAIHLGSSDNVTVIVVRFCL